jgi:hypothetical protein
MSNSEIIDTSDTSKEKSFYVSKPERRKKIFIGTPAYDGKVHVPYAMSLLDTNEILRNHGYEVLVRLPVGGSLLVADRNRILQMFWELEADYILCIDSDLGWDPRVILKMLHDIEENGKDFVAGVYPSRDGKGFNFRPFQEPDGRITMCEKTNLLKMEYIPAGFMLFTRDVVKKLRDNNPQRYYSPKDPRSDTESTYCLFDTEVWEGEFWGEDYVFCRRVGEVGVDIWVDPLIEFNHAGVVGSLIQALTTDPSKAQK